MIVVTGGAGFIGSNLMATLAQQNRGPLVIIDDFGHTEKWQNIKRLNLEDIINPAICFKFLETNKNQIQTIIHLGAISTTTETDVDLIVQTNFNFSKNLLNWCTAHRKPFIYASSGATYGDGSQGFADSQDLDSLKKLIPLNAYAWSKHLFDQFVASYQASNKWLFSQVVGLKFFNVYGPNEYHKAGQMSVVYQIYHQIKDGQSPAKLFKSYHSNYVDGDQLRDFIWIEDCTNIIYYFLDNPQISGLFNVGSGQASTFNALAQAVFRALNLPDKISYTEMPKALQQKYQYFTQADISKLRRAGYSYPMTSLEQGVKKYVQSYLTQPDSYR